MLEQSDTQLILAQFKFLSDDISDIRQKVGSLDSAIGNLRKEVSVLHKDIDNIKRDVANIQQDVIGLKQEVSAIFEQTSLIPWVAEALANQSEDSSDHERRIKILERIRT